MPNLPLCHWSSQLFDLRAPSSTDVPVLLLNQPIIILQMEKVEEDLARSKNLREKQAKEFSRQLDDLKIKHEKEVHFFVCQFCPEVVKNIHRVSLP